MSKKKQQPMMLPIVPQAPAYQAPAPYVPPPPAAQAPDPQTVIPKVLTSEQVIREANQREFGQDYGGVLPSFLQLNAGPTDPTLRAAAEADYWTRNVRPQVEQAKADLARSGQDLGSYGGALLGQIMGQGTLNQFQAGLAQAQQDYNNLLSGRQSYYAGGPTLVTGQNAADVSRGQNVSQLQTQQASDLNNYNMSGAKLANDYNLGSSQLANNFSQGIFGSQAGLYGSQVNAYNQQLNNEAAKKQNQYNLLGGLIRGGATLAGAYFGAPQIGNAVGNLAATPFDKGPSIGSTYPSLGGGILGNYGTKQVGGFSNSGLLNIA